MNIPKGFGLIFTMIGVTILLYSLSFNRESFFDIPSGGIFLGIMTILVGIIVYMNSKKNNAMIPVR